MTIDGERRLGRVRDGSGRYARLAERAVVHGVPVDVDTLLARVVPDDARFLVLDLDRTLHLGRNMGELLGFEISAELAYGRARREGVTGTGRFAVDLRDVPGTLRYVRLGLESWAVPGLHYLFFGKLARRTRATRRLAYRLFGPEPVRRVQAIPQTTLLHQLTAFPPAELRRLARAVWDRHADDLVVTREALDALRARCPDLRIVLTSASPRPVVEVAAEVLGVDEVDFTYALCADDRSGAPFGPDWVARRAAQPAFVAPPSRVRINSSYAKIEGLLRRHPEIGRGEVVTVGITDTGYGEDHCFTEFFTHVVDVNSDAPFSPVVPATSPLREVHSAHVLSRGELRRRAVEPGYLDPRRPMRPPGRDVALDRAQLATALADVLEGAEAAARRYDASFEAVSAAREALARSEGVVLDRVEMLCAEYNRAEGTLREVLLAELDAVALQLRRMVRTLAVIERPVSEAAFELTQLLEAARARIEPRTALPEPTR